MPQLTLRTLGGWVSLLASSAEDVLLAGDINLHMDENEHYSSRFKEIMDSFNLIQHIDFPTHKHGHTLDIVATFDGGTLMLLHLYHARMM